MLLKSRCQKRGLSKVFFAWRDVILTVNFKQDFLNIRPSVCLQQLVSKLSCYRISRSSDIIFTSTLLFFLFTYRLWLKYISIRRWTVLLRRYSIWYYYANKYWHCFQTYNIITKIKALDRWIRVDFIRTCKKKPLSR